MRTPREEADDVTAKIVVQAPELRKWAMDSIIRDDIQARIENARADGLVQGLAMLPSIRARFTVPELADSLDLACSELGLKLEAVRERIP